MGFFEEFFTEPIIKSTGYNVINTIVYALILIASVFVLMEVLKKLRIRLDSRLWHDLIPFVLLGGVLRALQDANFFAGLGAIQYLFISPLIYVVVFLTAFSCILVSKKWKNFTRITGISLLSFFSVFIILKAVNFSIFLLIFFLTIFVFSTTFIFLRFLKIRVLGKQNWQVLFAHVLDSCASVSAVAFLGFREQHVVPSALFNAFPIWTFIPLKIFIVLLILYVLDRETKGSWNWMLKFTVLVLGLGPGTRNALTALMH